MSCLQQLRRHAVRRLPTVAAVLTAAFIAACDQAPTVGTPTTLATVCDRANDGKRVALEGYLSLPRSYTENSSSQSAPVVIRGDLPQAGDVTFVWLAYGSGPNSMDQVPDTYTQQDLKVRANDGAAVGYQDHVRVSGAVTFPSTRPYEINSQGGRLLDCGLNNPLIERL